MDRPMNLRERSAMTLSRVEQNDPTLTRLELSNAENITNEKFQYWPSDRELSRLGDAIGKNTHLRKLYISSHEIEEVASNDSAFFDGLKSNSSINVLAMGESELRFDLSRGFGYEIINDFVANNNNLTKISFVMCTLGNRGSRAIALALSSCTNLERFWLVRCHVDDDMLEEMVSGIRGLNQLEYLGLCMNDFGRAGCEALSSLLQDPNSNLVYLGLVDELYGVRNDGFVDNDCAAVLANALKGNIKLQCLNLRGNRTITESGWNSFSKILCDVSSVNTTYHSNHALKSLNSRGNHADLPSNLSLLLKLNSSRDKKKVAMKKILLRHSHLDMEPFLEWDLKVLPLAVSWLDKAREYAKVDKVRIKAGKPSIDAMKLSAIYQFARAMPLMFVSPKKASTKRKIDEVLTVFSV